MFIRLRFMYVLYMEVERILNPQNAGISRYITHAGYLRKCAACWLASLLGHFASKISMYMRQHKSTDIYKYGEHQSFLHETGNSARQRKEDYVSTVHRFLKLKSHLDTGSGVTTSVLYISLK